MLQLWASRFGVASSDRPIFRTETADIVVAELGQFSPHQITLPSADRAAAAALPAFTLLEIEQVGVGTIGFGYVLNPRRQIDANGAGQIILSLFPLTQEATRYRTRRGWVAANKLSVIASRLGNLIGGDARVPQWTGVYLDAATVDPTFSVRYENPTVLDAFLQLATDSGQFVRIGRDAAGAPTRTLEMGQFGLDSGVALVSADGAYVDDLVAQGKHVLVTQFDHAPNNVETMVNIATPLGGGSGDTQVSLERLWRMINDKDYVNFGRWGTHTDSLSRSPLATTTNAAATATSRPPVLMFAGTTPSSTPVRAIPLGVNVTVAQWAITGTDGDQWAHVTYGDATGTTTGYMRTSELAPSLFPEYDPVNYPIDCVESEQGGGRTFYDPGLYGSRAATLDGRWDYDMYDFSSVVEWGTQRGEYMDAGLNYADATVANQELTARALYVAMTAAFKKRGHPHETWHCTTTGTIAPPNAGDTVTVDYRKVSYDDEGAIVEEDIFVPLKVMQVVRHFSGDATPTDEYTLSNLGRFDDDDATVAADAAHQVRAVQINQGTGLTLFPIWGSGNVDADNDLVMVVDLPKQVFRVTKASLRVDFLRFQQTGTTAQNPTGTNIEILGTDNAAGIIHGVHDLTGGGVGDTGLTGTTDGFDIVQKGSDNDAVIRLDVVNDPDPNIGATPGNNLRIFQDGAGYSLKAGVVSNRSGGAKINSTITFTKDKTKSGFTAAVNKAVDVATRLKALLPPHVHPIDEKMPTTTHQPVKVSVFINGVGLSSKAVIASGSQDSDGDFTSSLVIDDISQWVNFPGTAVELRFRSHAIDGTNNSGTGFLRVSGTWIIEIGATVTTNITAN